MVVRPRTPSTGFASADPPPVDFTITIYCTRASHRVTFYFNKTERLQKVGQLPSYADLQIGEIGEDVKQLDRDDQRELVKAVRLFSSDAAIGGFVYLRRLFERLIARAYAVGDPIQGFESMRMDERIGALKGRLPAAMTSNAGVWRVLSKGIHALEEADCQRYFPVMRAAIGQMLEQEAHLRRARETEAATTRALQQVLAEVENPAA